MSIRWMIVLVFLLAACGGGDADTSEPDTSDEGGIQIEGAGERVPVTIEAPPEWREATAVLTLDNIASAQYLGRLDNISGQFSTVFAHRFSPDSTQLAGLDRTNLIAWDLITGETLFLAGRGDANTLYYSSDKSEIYTINSDGTVFIYDAEGGEITNDLRGHTVYSGASYYDDVNDLLVIGGTDGTVKVWDMRTRTSLVTIETNAGEVNAVALSPDSEMLVTGGTQVTVEFWQWRERELIDVTVTNGDPVERIVFAPTGDSVAIATIDAILIWDVETQDDRYVLLVGPSGAGDVMRYSPDGTLLVTGGAAPNMAVWSLTDGARVASLPGVGTAQVSATFSPDGSLLLTTVRGGDVTLWNMNSLSDAGIASAPLDVDIDRIFAVDWSADGFVMTLFDEVGPIYVWGIPAESGG